MTDVDPPLPCEISSVVIGERTGVQVDHRAEVRQLMLDGIESGSAGVYDDAFRHRLSDRSRGKRR